MSETLYIPLTAKEQRAGLPPFEGLKTVTVALRKRIAELLDGAGFSYSEITARTKTPSELNKKIRWLQGRGIDAPVCDIHSVTVEAPGPYDWIIGQIQEGFPGSPKNRFRFGVYCVQHYPPKNDYPTSSTGLWVALGEGAGIGEVKFTPVCIVRH